MEMALKALANHDTDIAEASHEAEARGKKLKITESPQNRRREWQAEVKWHTRKPKYRPSIFRDASLAK